MKIDPSKLSLPELEALDASLQAEIHSRYLEIDRAPLYESWRD